MLHRLAGLALAVLALLVPASVAAAAPVTVNLRVEGATTTLFEGPVTTDAKAALATPSSGGPHPCDVGENTSPPSAIRSATPTTALADSGLPWDAAFSTAFGNEFLVSQIAGEGSQTSFWQVNINGQETPVGGCQIAVNQGDNVVWALDGFGRALLALSGPATATTGVPFAVTVIDSRTGNAVAGATVGGATTDAAGNASVTVAGAGAQRLKAEAPGAIRSNALVVSVAAPGQTAVPAANVAGIAIDRTAPRARLLSPRNGHTYRRTKFSPRLIRVAVAESGSGVRTVKLRLTRRVGNRCFSFSGKRERFIGTKCGSGAGFFFTVSDRSDFSYLLPERLSRGHYVLDVEAIDRSFNRDTVGDRGRNRSVFDVR
jgi:uncharacterized protein DUF4430